MQLFGIGLGLGLAGPCALGCGAPLLLGCAGAAGWRVAARLAAFGGGRVLAAALGGALAGLSGAWLRGLLAGPAGRWLPVLGGAALVLLGLWLWRRVGGAAPCRVGGPAGPGERGLWLPVLALGMAGFGCGLAPCGPWPAVFGEIALAARGWPDGALYGAALGLGGALSLAGAAGAGLVLWRRLGAARLRTPQARLWGRRLAAVLLAAWGAWEMLR